MTAKPPVGRPLKQLEFALELGTTKYSVSSHKLYKIDVSSSRRIISFIYSNILSWNVIEKNLSGHVGTRTCVAGINSQQTCYIL